MEKITITIPDNLTPEEEFIEVSKQLTKKLIPTKVDKKLLGKGYEIKHLETQIIIKREPVEAVIISRECSVCNTIFEEKAGIKLWTNYGGKKRKLHYCSEECRNIVLDFSGPGRAAIKKSDLKTLNAW